MQPILKPITSQAEWHALQDAAAKDDHQVIAPTHLVMLDKEIVGYYGINGIPTIQGWLHSEKLRGHARQLMNVAENIVWGGGARRLLFLISPDSPVKPHLAKLGYDVIGETMMTTKGI